MQYGYKAYQTASENFSSHNEALALKKACDLLREAQKTMDKHVLEDALNRNQKMWTVFQTAMLDENNPLDSSIKINIIRLGKYIDRRTYEILGSLSPDPKMLDILIKINENIALGLLQNPGTNNDYSNSSRQPTLSKQQEL